MLESILVIMIAMGFVMFILGVTEKSIVFSATSMLMWIVVLAGQQYIEVPNDASTYTETAVFAVALGLIIINVVWIIIRYFENQFEHNMP